MTAPLPKYRVRFLDVPKGHRARHLVCPAPTAAQAAEQFLQRRESAADVPTPAFIEVERDGMAPIQFRADAGLSWTVNELKAWDGNAQRRWAKKGDAPL